MLATVLALLAFTVYALFDIISTPKPPEKTAAAPHEKQTAPAVANVNATRTSAAPVSVAEKKHRFLSSLLPAVRRVKARLDAEYSKALRLSKKTGLTAEEAAWLEAMKRRYRVTGIPCLLRRMHTHPVSIVLAQAALETGWGVSRFFKEAANVFGIWSYHKDEPRIAAEKTRNGKTVHVKKFASLDDAVAGYFHMIASGYAYDDFRKARMRTDNPFRLLPHLRNYSELRDEYVARLYYVIRANRLYRYDDPAYTPPPLETILPEYAAQKHREKAERLLALNEVKIAETNTSALPCDDNGTEIR